MGTDQLGVLWLILSSLAFFAMLFGLRYMSNKENMAMIEKGLNPKIKPQPAPFRNLKWGLLFVGAGLGLFFAYLLDNFALYRIHSNHDWDYPSNWAIYFALIAIGGGLGLIVSYRIEKKEFLDKQDN
jgi:heme/copper-type cytochrome/quinol oxidase subunit 3